MEQEGKLDGLLTKGGESRGKWPCPEHGGQWQESEALHPGSQPGAGLQVTLGHSSHLGWLLWVPRAETCEVLRPPRPWGVREEAGGGCCQLCPTCMRSSPVLPAHRGGSLGSSLLGWIHLLPLSLQVSHGPIRDIRPV